MRTPSRNRHDFTTTPMQYIVVCLPDLGPASNDPAPSYVLATRQVFDDYRAAVRYMRTVNVHRQPCVVAGEFSNLRLPE